MFNMLRKERRVLQNLGICQLSGPETLSEISRRVQCARLWCNSHNSTLLSNPRLESKTKFLLYKLFVRPILTYGCELWNLNNCYLKKLLVFEYSLLLQIFKTRYSRKYHKRLRPSIQEVYYSFQEPNIIEYVKNQRLSWHYLLQCEKRALRHRSPMIRWWDQLK